MSVAVWVESNLILLKSGINKMSIRPGSPFRLYLLTKQAHTWDPALLNPLDFLNRS
jgi:hypothetical protein